MTDPIPMVLHCPACGAQHTDAPTPCDMGAGCEEAGACFAEAHGEPDRCNRWTNPPHRSHLCAHCGFTWRPADVCTTGVEKIQTEGKNDDDLSDWLFCPSERMGFLSEAIDYRANGLGFEMPMPTVSAIIAWCHGKPDRYHLVSQVLAVLAASPGVGVVPERPVPRQPPPNINWCIGCDPDNCSGCGPITSASPAPAGTSEAVDAALGIVEVKGMRFPKGVLDVVEAHAKARGIISRALIRQIVRDWAKV